MCLIGLGNIEFAGAITRAVRGKCRSPSGQTPSDHVLRGDWPLYSVAQNEAKPSQIKNSQIKNRYSQIKNTYGSAVQLELQYSCNRFGITVDPESITQVP